MAMVLEIVIATYLIVLVIAVVMQSSIVLVFVAALR